MPPWCDHRADPHAKAGRRDFPIGHDDFVQAQAPIKDRDAQARLAECVVALSLLRQCHGHVFVDSHLLKLHEDVESPLDTLRRGPPVPVGRVWIVERHEVS